jgi:hypothetical protein
MRVAGTGLAVSGGTTIAPIIIICSHITTAVIPAGVQEPDITITETTYYTTGVITVAMEEKQLKIVTLIL